MRRVWLLLKKNLLVFYPGRWYDGNSLFERGGSTVASNCEECVYGDYDSELDALVCNMDLDEDEMERFLRGDSRNCPFYRRGTDYTTAAKQ